MIILVAAIGDDLSLGKSGGLLWNIPEDLKHFREITLGKTIVMGRKTWESIGGKPLPGRKNLVMTRNSEGIDEKYLYREGYEDLYVIGGGEIYRYFLPFSDKLYLTRVHKEYPDADTFFPKIDKSEWKLEEIGFPKTTGEIHYEVWTKIKKD